MKILLILLAVSALYGKSSKAAGRASASQGHLSSLFTANIRSSAVRSHRPEVDSARPVDQAELSRCCERIMLDIQRVFFLSDRNGRMKLQIRGVYAHGTVLFFRLELNNRSPQDYELDSIRFLVMGTGKGSPAGARPLLPLLVYGGTTVVPCYSKAASIFVLPHFTLPLGGQLLIRMKQTNGGRPLQVSATRWTLARARLI